ncbi:MULTISPECIES: hypothetical protein [unclassified Acinetobacter]|uniref:hypothetical protein n=1 Tax=unclassified Acinetobacter TaxID=196816 RepID=UPI0025779763|nr:MULTISPECIES: hypothetical protein [unclassified Acinetobacter]MDM1764411.1 hypothetical protein [Acinetobacter sp. 226-1]MDM1767385.1 hypothetical protein [Acinetobacter sp. 226-4]
MSIPEIPSDETSELVQQEETQSNSATDLINHTNPIDVLDLAVELGKGTLDLISSALDSLDISF